MDEPNRSRSPGASVYLGLCNTALPSPRALPPHMTKSQRPLHALIVHFECCQLFTAMLPAEKSPTISRLSDSAWVAVEVILEEKQERDLIPRLKRAGASGIITYPLNKVIP